MAKQRNPINITRGELVEILRNVNSPMFISFISKTPVKMNQYLDYWVIDPQTGRKMKNLHPTRNPYFDSGVLNLSRNYKIVTGFDYENSVNGRREKEGKDTNFVGKDNWFEVVSKGLVINKNDGNKFYIRYQRQPDSILEQEYIFDGNMIEKQLFESYMTKRSEYENQGLDNPLRFEVCSIDNLLQISINNEVYVLD